MKVLKFQFVVKGDLNDVDENAREELLERFCLVVIEMGLDADGEARICEWGEEY